MEGKREEEPPDSDSDCDCDHNWAELPRDVLMLIFLKIGLIDVLRSAEFVCRSWRRVTKEEPDLWRKIDTTNYALSIYYDESGYDTSMVIGLTRLAIDRSMGRLEEFSVADFGVDELLQYLCAKTSVLKKLCLKSCEDLSGSAIAETARRQPLLEEIEIEMEEITSGCFSEEVIKIVGKECPQLKVFKFNCTWWAWEDYVAVADVALGIAKTMHQLRHLELIGNRLTNVGLKAILDGCLHLETLDIRECFKVNMDANMQICCAKRKTLRLPDYECSSDYDYEDCVDVAEDGFGYICW